MKGATAAPVRCFLQSGLTFLLKNKGSIQQESSRVCQIKITLAANRGFRGVAFVLLSGTLVREAGRYVLAEPAAYLFVCQVEK